MFRTCYSKPSETTFRNLRKRFTKPRHFELIISVPVLLPVSHVIATISVVPFRIVNNWITPGPFFFIFVFFNTVDGK